MKTRSTGIRKYADGGIVNVASPPVGMTNLTQNPVPAQAPQPSSYQGFNDVGMDQMGPVGTGITQPTGNLLAKNRMTGALGMAPETQSFAKGGMVKKKRSKGGMAEVRGYGKARSKPCKIC